MDNNTKKYMGFWDKYSRSGLSANYGTYLYHLEAVCAAKELATNVSNAHILSLGTGLGQVEIELQSLLAPRAYAKI